MKHPRLLLWYPSVVVMTIAFIVITIVETVFSLLRASFAVLEVLSFRFEMWCKYNEPGSIYNCPWKKTLKQVFVENLESY